MAFFASISPLARPPTVMNAIVVLDEVPSLTLDQDAPSLLIDTFVVNVSVHDIVCAGDKPVFIPLITRAIFPWYTANVTELSAT